MSNNRFGVRGAFTCTNCKKLTRETGEGNGAVELCGACYQEMELRNEHRDGGHEVWPSLNCTLCVEVIV
jgi:hypothetical protein